MNKLFCLFRDFNFSRFIFQQEQGGESFAEEAKRKARKFNKEVGESVDSAGRAIAGAAKTAGEAVVGTAKEVPEVFKDAGSAVARAHEATVDAATNVIESAVSGVVDLRSDMVEKMANTFASIDENISGAKKAAWEKVKPVVAVLVGTGYLALDKVEKIAGEAKDFSVAKLNTAIDWGKVAKDYVKDGAVNFALATKELGKDTADFLNDSYEAMVSGTASIIEVAVVNAKAAGRSALEFHEEGIDRVARVMVAIDNGVTGTARKAWEKARPVVAVLVGEGYLAVEKVTELGSDAKKFTMAKLEKAVDLAKFAANYVKDGVVDKAKVVAELGKDAGNFVVAVWDKAAEKTKMAVNEAVGLAVAAGRNVEEFREDIVDQVATAILTVDNTATGAAKKSWEAVRPAVIVLAGQGYLAVDKVEEWAGDVKDFSAEKLYAALDYGKFAVDYVKNGVVDMKRVAEDFGEDVAEKVARVYQKAAERVGEHIELAQKEGYRILGEEVPSEIPPQSMLASAQKAPKQLQRQPSRAPVPESKQRAQAKSSEEPSVFKKIMAKAIESGAEVAKSTYIVKKGDTMWGIMEKTYGDGTGKYWKQLLKVNGMKMTKVAGKDYPQALKIGQQLKLPKTLDIGQGSVLNRLS